jgi:hypothetical protein
MNSETVFKNSEAQSENDPLFIKAREFGLTQLPGELRGQFALRVAQAVDAKNKAAHDPDQPTKGGA